MSNLITISGVKGYIDENGVAQLNLEDCARGLGFVDNSKEVEYVRWNTVTGYLRSFGFSQEVAKETFIPENIFYRLAMKAKNETAEKFQAIVCDEILPQIRKTGSYQVKPLTQLEILAQSTQILIEQDKAIKELNTKQEEQGEAIRQLTAQAKTSPNEYFTVAGYASLRGAKIDISKAGLMGRKASKLSHEYGVEIGKISDPRFGRVNTYHTDVLKEVFA